MHAFQRQNTAQTLRDGIAEYYRDNPGLKRGEAIEPDAQAFFRCHDTVHVVFGCDTTLQQEAVVKLSSFFGTTEGLGVMRGYQLYDSIDIYRQLRMADILATMASAVISVPRTLWRCRRQAKRWPWSDFEPYLDTPLADLRAEFGIRVATA